MKFANRIKKPFVYTPSNKTDVAETFRRVRKQQAEEEAKKLAADPVVKQIRRKA